MAMQSPHDDFAQLSPDDQRVLDALAEAGFSFDEASPAQLAPDDLPRAERLAHLLGLLNDYPVESSDDTLLHATLARIDRHEDERAARMAFDAESASAGRGRRIRLPDFISVAAVILIGASVLWPALSTMRRQALDEQCSNNLRQVGYAFGQYANDFNGAMPIAQAGFISSWDTVSNVINLGPLVDRDYCDADHLNCPCVKEDDYAVASYSYQLQAPNVRWVWGGPQTTIVLSDRNPLIDAFRRGVPVQPSALSFNHGGRGQNVLSTDGGAEWTEQAVHDGDNIWLPDGLDTLRAGARPASAIDVFLTH